MPRHLGHHLENARIGDVTPGGLELRLNHPFPRHRECIVQRHGCLRHAQQWRRPNRKEAEQSFESKESMTGHGVRVVGMTAAQHGGTPHASMDFQGSARSRVSHRVCLCWKRQPLVDPKTVANQDGIIQQRR